MRLLVQGWIEYAGVSGMAAKLRAAVGGRLPKTIHQVSIEIDQELRFHMDSTIERLIREHKDPTEVVRIANEQFGDIAQIRAELMSIAMRPWRRLLAWTTGLLALSIALAAAGGFAWSSQLKAQAHTASSLRDELGRTRVALLSTDIRDQLEPAQSVRFIRIHGAILRPSVWTFTRATSITLGQLIAKSGGETDAAAGWVYITDDTSEQKTTICYELGSILHGEGSGLSLPKSCTIYIEPVSD